MKRIAILSLLAAMLLVPSTNAVARGGQWSKEKAAEWYASQKWPVGCNYVPSYAINQYEIWQPETFNPEIIDNELSLAESIGFNTLRIYLHEGLWYADKVGFKKRIDQFLDIADKHGMKLIITFFTNGGNHDKVFRLGPQPEAIPGTHNSNWIPSPGKAVLDDPAQWPRLKNMSRTSCAHTRTTTEYFTGACAMSPRIRKTDVMSASSCRRYTNGHGKSVQASLSVLLYGSVRA